MPARSTSPLPSADLCARIALTCAGLSGNRHLGHALRDTSPVEVLADLWEGGTAGLPDEVAARARRLGTPKTVAAALQNTQRAGMRILTPASTHWPAGLDGLGCAAPLLLWTSGDAELLNEPAIVVTGGTRPDAKLRRVVIDLSTRLADRGWTLAATVRPGVDQLVRDAGVAMGGRVVTVATTARAATSSGELLISENPPLVPVVLASVLRTPVLLATLGGRVVAADAVAGTGAGRTSLAAHALGIPLGVLDEVGTGAGGYGARFDAPLIRTLEEVERLV